MLVEYGAKVDLPAGAGKGNFTALVFAAEQGHLNVVKKLVELGASPDIRGKSWRIISDPLIYQSLFACTKDWPGSHIEPVSHLMPNFF